MYHFALPYRYPITRYRQALLVAASTPAAQPTSNSVYTNTPAILYSMATPLLVTTLTNTHNGGCVEVELHAPLCLYTATPLRRLLYLHILPSGGIQTFPP